ncbi:hypothetical protein EMPS_00022 [Entomortierella parvispora]|uniref:Uncharacterized protein n=1 Tax=Entomortierella parvispora TaxID=205924 RepID=A0A9P3LPT0_9FUNG|nr:hypothetical protein EMPS_00022 [Entomortierella parvispora]
MDASGYRGVIMYLRRYEDIYVAGSFAKRVITLPQTADELEVFLRSSTLGLLVEYVEHLIRIQSEVKAAGADAELDSFLWQTDITSPMTSRDLNAIVANSPKRNKH